MYQSSKSNISFKSNYENREVSSAKSVSSSTLILFMVHRLVHLLISHLFLLLSLKRFSILICCPIFLIMVDLGGYVIILVETKNKKIKLYGSPADKDNLEVGDEILEINGKTLDNATHTEVISHIHDCIRSRTIYLRVKRKNDSKLDVELSSSNVQDAFVIAVEQQARERLERLSVFNHIKPVDMTKLSHQLNSEYLKNKRTMLTNGLNGSSAMEMTEFSTTNDNRNNNSSFVLDAEKMKSINRTKLSSFNDEKRPPSPEMNFHSDSFDMMLIEDGQRHREMAVDVPDTFIGRKKTPPKYPPPASLSAAVQQIEMKPLLPPRDHSLAPSLPSRTSSTTTTSTVTVPIETIKKYEDHIRARKFEEDQKAAETEFLNRSLRGSKKLKALENYNHGIVNDAYDDYDEDNPHEKPSLSSNTSSLSAYENSPEIVHTSFDYGSLVTILQRLQTHLSSSQASVPLLYPLATDQNKILGIEARITAVQSLLLSPEFGRTLAIHNSLQKARNKFTRKSKESVPIEEKPSEIRNIVHECLELLPNNDPSTIELMGILSGYEMEALFQAHDQILNTIDTRSPFFLRWKVEDLKEKYVENSNIRIVKIEKSAEPLGATVRNEGEWKVVVGRIVRGGMADKNGLLHEGDEVLEVNGIDMRGKNVNTVCDLLANMSGMLTFLIVPAQTKITQTNQPSQQQQLQQQQQQQQQQLQNPLYVKAHFNYDPEDDLYIPCRELGISFQKGDVLRVISQEDPNWWQAYRLDEEDSTLAGLIPSRSFQRQREAIRRAAGGFDEFSDFSDRKKGARDGKNRHKASTLLCAKKSQKKLKKKKTTYSDGGYPIYTSNIDEYDNDEILTYEELALYYPRANHKRPVVLIGPPNIGRHELRQKLMEDSERFAAAVPHTSRARKEGEIDGQDYHFITRAQFEADILSRKFVEHGEYERAFYGTSLDAIRSVVSSSKICVLNLHPQSLKILRTSDLKPFVVFIAPPSLEKLRQKKIRLGEQFKDEELNEIIEKAREMEDKYGHFFDLILINNDTDRAYQQLLSEINNLERASQWVPAAWVKSVQ